MMMDDACTPMDESVNPFGRPCSAASDGVTAPASPREHECLKLPPGIPTDKAAKLYQIGGRAVVRFSDVVDAVLNEMIGIWHDFPESFTRGRCWSII